MTGSMFSASWYRVAALTPRLRTHAQIHRHQYRGETWYVLRDLFSDRVHRFSPAGHLVIGLMDGRRTVQQIWDLAVERLGDDAPTQDEMIRLLSQLHTADVLQCDVPPDTAEMLARHERQQRRTWVRRLMSPLAWRIPILDPERFLVGLTPLGRPLFGVTGALLWLAVVGPAALLAAVHWRDLTDNLLDQLLTPQTAVLLWLLFPAVKALHELGHAFAVKVFGGEVHDMGVMFLVVTPVPYVDASSASAFRSKWQRIVVGAAGMIVELFLAALALFVWLSAEAGVVRALAYGIIMIAGLSTVLFNANPLLRYDGYYMLADWLEIPNLYTRSRAYLAYLVQRSLFGRRDAELPPASPSERAWFVGYAVLSFVYRAAVVVVILLFVIGLSFYLGVALAVLAAVPWVLVPAAKALTALVSGPRLRPVRARAITVSAALAALVVGLVGFVPVPYRSRAEGIVWIPESAFVRAETQGFIERVVAPPGARVRRGDLLIVCRDPELAARREVLVARVREVEARYDEQRAADTVRAEIIREELSYAREELARVGERLAGLAVRSGADGTFVVPLVENLPGRFVRRGEVLAHVVDLETLTVRTVVPQSEIDLVRHRTGAIEVRLAERLAEPRPAVLRRHVPGASERLPSPALGIEGGGRIPVDPRDAQLTKAMEKVFQVDLELPAPGGLINVGGRVYVRFDHGWAPLAAQGYRWARQLFLARFNV